MSPWIKETGSSIRHEKGLTKVNRQSEFGEDKGVREAEYREPFWEYIKLGSL